MKTQRLFLFAAMLLTAISLNATNVSAYKQKVNDDEAFYFSSQYYNIKSDGKTDVSDELQKAINQVKKEKNFGILFIPQGKYLISKTIYIPNAVRVIGYGNERPEFILAANSKGFADSEKYMFYFTSGLVEGDAQPQDAHAGTFYSAISNVNFRILDGNPQAVAVRAHFAQHGFVSHCAFYTGNGKAGISEVGNELENLDFYDGDYGIIAGRTTPGWPLTLVDATFQNQRKAALQTRETGFVLYNVSIKNTPLGVEMLDVAPDRLYAEKTYFENVSNAAVSVGQEGILYAQLNMKDCFCKNVPTAVSFQTSGVKVEGRYDCYKINELSYGLVMKDMTQMSEYETLVDFEQMDKLPQRMLNELPALPQSNTWVNVKDLGAKGDGETDDTKVFEYAISKYTNIYVPQGWYRLTKTLKLNKNTKLIGLHPFATQFILKESEPAFSGFGTPVPLIESYPAGNNILNGIGIFTGAYNYRAVGCKWLSNEKSMINDVKFVGGHGTMFKPKKGEPYVQRPYRYPEKKISTPQNPVYEIGKDMAWDNQYWSLWITDGGGGYFKDIWSADTYATNALYVSNTATKGRIFAMSMEHHVRNEARFYKVQNWDIYAFQFEEEGREGKDCLMMQIQDCKNLLFANVWMYRVIRANTPKKYGVKVSNSENIRFRNFHNYTQVLPVIEKPIVDMGKDLSVYDWDFAYLNITGNEKSNKEVVLKKNEPVMLCDELEFPVGAAVDSKGDFYFCETRLKKVFKWSTEDNMLTELLDYPLKPFTLAFDTQDNMLVFFRYDPQPGFMVDGKQETVEILPDDNPWYSGWGNGGWTTLGYSVNLQNPDSTMTPLVKKPTANCKKVKKIIYPASRWRGDFEKVALALPENSFVAPDGVTIIPETYDLSRSAALTEIIPGQTQPFYQVNEIIKSTIAFDVDKNGRLSNMRKVFPYGQYSNVVDDEGNVYVADGYIYVYNKNAELINKIVMKERPQTLAIGGKDKDILFITTSNSIWGMKIK